MGKAKGAWGSLRNAPPQVFPSRQTKAARDVFIPHRMCLTQTLKRTLEKGEEFRYNEGWRSNAAVWEVLLLHRGAGEGWSPVPCLYLSRLLL